MKKYDLEEFITSECIKNVNLLFGKSKNNKLSLGLFLQVPIKINLSKVNFDLKFDKLLDFSTYYVNLGNSVEIHFDFLYKEEEDIEKIMKVVQEEMNLLSFIYVHELSHIMRKHNTPSYNRMMVNIVRTTLPNINDAKCHEMINIAEDYAINYAIKSLMPSSMWNEIESNVLYNKDYEINRMSDIEILKDIDKNINFKQLSPEYTKSQRGIGKVNKSSGGSVEEAEMVDELISNLSDSLKSTMAGSLSDSQIEDLFKSKKVDTGFVKKLKASMQRRVYKHTNNSYSSWSGLNNKYRKIFKSPKRVFLEDKINIVLLVDSSGSVSTDSLAKLLYVIESMSRKIETLTVMIHDTKVVKTTVLTNTNDIQDNPKFIETMATRVTVGGTSHKEPLQDMLEILKSSKNHTIPIIFSDFYSDLESLNLAEIKRYDPYWIHTAEDYQDVAEVVQPNVSIYL